MLAVERYESSKADLPDLVDETGRDSRDSMEDIAQDVVELDRKVGLLTEANAQLENERDMLVVEQVCSYCARLLIFISGLSFDT